MPKAKMSDVSLHYDLRGSGDPVVMIMGLGASSAVWDPRLVEELAQSFKVLTFDNRGVGQSDKPDIPYSLEMFADDTVDLMDALGIERAHIFGVSMGGMIAQEFALRHPGRLGTLTLGCTTAGGAHAVPPPPESMKILTAPRDGVAPDEIIRRGWPLSYTPDFIRDHRDELEAAIERILEHPTPPYAFTRQLEATYTLKTWDRLPDIKAPTLVVTGAKDVLIPAKNSELLAERIPGAHLQVIKDSGHGFMHQGRSEFLRVYVPFLKEHPIQD